MHTTLVALNAATNAHMDGLHCAMEAWFNLSTYLGFRLCEWAQEDDYRCLASGGKIAPNGTKRAFTLNDIRLFDSSNHPVSIRVIILFRLLSLSRILMPWPAPIVGSSIFGAGGRHTDGEIMTKMARPTVTWADRVRGFAGGIARPESLGPEHEKTSK
ncbi:unnamed protein product [Cylindrotheca closterium]|uniref:Uncharacterized protein n=1 Tax=Cylindrotheca closterium TaxID=2856 RepID=A0AAD2FJP9_9STRA|nr:unnamed protein product [Cylindrotheca closterium]